MTDIANRAEQLVSLIERTWDRAIKEIPANRELSLYAATPFQIVRVVNLHWMNSQLLMVITTADDKGFSDVIYISIESASFLFKSDEVTVEKPKIIVGFGKGDDS